MCGWTEAGGGGSKQPEEIGAAGPDQTVDRTAPLRVSRAVITLQADTNQSAHTRDHKHANIQADAQTSGVGCHYQSSTHLSFI